MALITEQETATRPTRVTAPAQRQREPTLETRPLLIPSRAVTAGALLIASLLWLWSGYAGLSANLPYAPITPPEVTRGRIVMNGDAQQKGATQQNVVLSESFKLEHFKPRLGEDGRPQLQRGVPIMDRYEETRRSYPQGQLAAQVLGFTGRDGSGLYGLEKFQNDTLSTGRDLVLTLDPVIQASTESALEKVVKEYRADWGTVVALEAGTNRILAIANYPTFNASNWRGGNEDEWRNRALRDQYDGGSTVKALTAAMLLSDGLADPDSKVYAPMSRTVPGLTINDVIRHPSTLSLRDVLRFSSNVGISTLAERLGKERLHTYLEKFGFGREVWPRDPSVTRSILRDWQEWRPADYATTTYGQGFTTTTLQLAAAFSVLVNDGQLIAPTLFEGQRVAPPTRVISAKAAAQSREMLEYTVRCGVKRAQVAGYAVGGKTGTAQTYSGDSISKTMFNALFVGFFPADKPRVTLLVQVWNPRETTHGSLVAAPAFKQIAEESLAHLRITPLTTEPSRVPCSKP